MYFDIALHYHAILKVDHPNTKNTLKNQKRIFTTVSHRLPSQTSMLTAKVVAAGSNQP